MLSCHPAGSAQLCRMMPGNKLSQHDTQLPCVADSPQHPELSAACCRKPGAKVIDSTMMHRKPKLQQQATYDIQGCTCTTPANASLPIFEFSCS